MIALYPPADIAAQLAVQGELPAGVTAIPPEELHITLAYFPTDDQATVDAATAAAARLASGFGPVTATITGWAEFIAGSNGEPHVLLFDSGNQIDEMQEYLTYCCMACGCQPATDHGYLPHMTVAYTKAGEEAEVGEDYPPTSILFSSVTVKFGDMRHDFMFAGAGMTMMMELREKVASLLSAEETEGVQSSRVSQQTERDTSVEQDTATDKAQWDTAYINDLPDSSFLYVEDGDKDEEGKTTPRSLRHFPVKDADGKVDIPHLRNAIARIPQSDIPDSKQSALQDRARAMLEAAQKSEKEGKRLGSAMLGKIGSAVQALTDFMTWAKYDDVIEVDPEQKELSERFLIRKQADGSYRWFSYSSNGFEDREGEIVSTKSLEDTVAYGDSTDDRGPLRLFHIQGTDIGECDFQAMEGRFLIESGTFGDSDLAKKALDYFLHTEDELGVSIGFLYPEAEFKDNVYGAIRIIERSVLPLKDAANPWTAFQTLKGGAVDERKQAFLSAISGDATAAEIIGRASAMTKTLEGAVAFKEQVAAEAAKAEDTSAEPTIEKALADAVAQAMTPVAEAIKAVVDRFDGFDARLAAIEATDKARAEAAEAATAAAAKAEEDKTKAPAGAAVFRATGAKENETPTALVEALVGKTEAGMSATAKAVAPFVADLLKMSGVAQ